MNIKSHELDLAAVKPFMNGIRQAFDQIDRVLLDQSASDMLKAEQIVKILDNTEL